MAFVITILISCRYYISTIYTDRSSTTNILTT
nr:MAG TPA: hypothetical protein [Caudoviricetes sp.]